jgi:methylenetetrahydrofolate dehydrogenase (NADP+)/methenyltetrahydrofolate cyclohydrolase
MPKEKHANATVTICHSATREINAHCRRADILIAAIGVRIRHGRHGEARRGSDRCRGEPGQDPPLKRLAPGGDVHFADVQPIAGKITQPGRRRPMTIAMLMQNIVRAAEQAADLSDVRAFRPF